MGLTNNDNLVLQTTTGLNTNSLVSVTTSLDVSENLYVTWAVIANSGTNSSHVMELQCSLDDTNWFAMSPAVEITGTGMNCGDVPFPAQYARVKVKTVEGASSTVNIIINAK